MYRSMVPLCVLIVAAPLFAAISYPPPTILTGGSGPFAIAVADFNNDCAADFATADQFANSVTVRFGSGGGAFPTLSTINGFVQPQAIVAGDFNNDGAPDLAIGNTAGFSAEPVGHIISILLNNNDAKDRQRCEIVRSCQFRGDELRIRPLAEREKVARTSILRMSKMQGRRRSARRRQTMADRLRNASASGHRGVVGSDSRMSVFRCRRKIAADCQE
jgi:hypothetical protein